jgi:predicted RND superfamily exporter protein
MLVLLPALMVKDHQGESWSKKVLNKVGLGVVVNLIEKLGSLISPIFSNPLTKFIGDLFQFRFMNNLGRFSENRGYSYSILMISIIVTIFSYLQFSNLSFEYNMMELEPEGMQSTIAQEKILDKFEISPDFAMFTTDSIQKCREKVRALKKMGNKTGIIGRVDAITEFYSKRSDQVKNSEDLAIFREKLSAQKQIEDIDQARANIIADQLERLHFNIVEIGELSIMSKGESNKIVRKCDQIVGKSDKDSKLLKLAEMIRSGSLDYSSISKFELGYFPHLKDALLKMGNGEIIELENLPTSIKRRYTNSKNSNLLVTVYPKSNIWEERNLKKFKTNVMKTDESITGMPLITLVFIDLTKDKGKLSTILGFIVIFVILLIDFRNIKYTLLATIPLIFGVIWMIGAMGYL